MKARHTSVEEMGAAGSELWSSQSSLRALHRSLFRIESLGAAPMKSFSRPPYLVKRQVIYIQYLLCSALLTTAGVTAMGK